MVHLGPEFYLGVLPGLDRGPGLVFFVDFVLLVSLVVEDLVLLVPLVSSTRIKK